MPKSSSCLGDAWCLGLHETHQSVPLTESQIRLCPLVPAVCMRDCALKRCHEKPERGTRVATLGFTPGCRLVEILRSDICCSQFPQWFLARVFGSASRGLSFCRSTLRPRQRERQGSKFTLQDVLGAWSQEAVLCFRVPEGTNLGAMRQGVGQTPSRGPGAIRTGPGNNPSLGDRTNM